MCLAEINPLLSDDNNIIGRKKRHRPHFANAPSGCCQWWFDTCNSYFSRLIYVNDETAAITCANVLFLHKKILDFKKKKEKRRDSLKYTVLHNDKNKTIAHWIAIGLAFGVWCISSKKSRVRWTSIDAHHSRAFTINWQDGLQFVRIIHFHYSPNIELFNVSAQPSGRAHGRWMQKSCTFRNTMQIFTPIAKIKKSLWTTISICKIVCFSCAAQCNDTIDRF